MIRESSTQARRDAGFLAGGGEMAELIRSRDWSATPLGSVESWPQSLRTTVSLCLASNFPINIIWGPNHTQIYNDGYRVVCGEGHPTFLGMDYSQSWASAWPVIGEPFARALAGETSFLENQRMFLHRNGYLEETFFTFSISPIRDETGGIGGLFHPVTETTLTMLGERRTRAVRDLNAHLGAAKTTDSVFQRTIETLGSFGFDLPFVLLYELAEDSGSYVLSGRFGIDAGASACPASLAPESDAPWPVRDLVNAPERIEIHGLRGMLSDSSCGPYEEAPDLAFAIPINLVGSDRPAAILIAGASPRLPLDDVYRGFYDLIAATLAAALATVRAYEAERKRAEALAEIDRAKTAFFSNVSHEFRTPLTLMLAPLEDALAESAGLPALQRERLDIAQRNALRLLKLVNSLLDFSRIEAKRIEASFEPTDLAVLTADLASNFRSACERAGLALKVECEPLPRLVDVDREMWEKIVLNLLSNAFKFTLEGGIAVRLGAAPSGVGVELSVRDTGVGIPAEELPRVFERFHRIQGQKGRTHEGTGIGLALVEELVKLHGGQVHVESGPGEGTEFRVAIPFVDGDLRGHGQIQAPGILSSTAIRAEAYVGEAVRWLPDDRGSGSNIPPNRRPGSPVAPHDRPRIVLADDNADMRAYVTRILQEGGYDVRAVENGALALIAVQEGDPPDLVLTDVMMPELDGFGLLQAMRTDPRLDDVRVVLLSARAGEEARVEGLAAGADDYLVKPFSARELRARIDGVVTLARQRREAAAREQELRAEIEAERGRAALRESERRMEFALEAGRLGSWELDLETRRFAVSTILRETLELDDIGSFVTYETLLTRLQPGDRIRLDEAMARAIDLGEGLDIELRTTFAGAWTGWILLRGSTLYAEDGKPLRMAGVSLDISARKAAEEQQRLLLDELNHRVKNTLATVQSIAMQTRRNAEGPAAFSEALEGRIQAMARAHDLLTQASWAGAYLSEVIGQTLSPYLTNGDGERRISQNGPQVRLGPNAAVTLNMAFHELATNAAKYGALTRPDGRISVTWDVDRTAEPQIIAIDWIETGGPRVSSPDRRGFGSRLIEQGVARELGGHIHLEFDPAGVQCRMRIPAVGKLEVPN